MCQWDKVSESPDDKTISKFSSAFLSSFYFVMPSRYDCKTQSQDHWSLTSFRIVKNDTEVDVQLLGLLEPEAEADAKH